MNKTLEEILKLNDPLGMFDLVIAASYFAGKFDNPIPVDDSRKVFEAINKIKKLEIIEMLKESWDKSVDDNTTWDLGSAIDAITNIKKL